jgi:alkylation response protein AidB-like acyl-CoA dehydrogenase
MYLNLDLTESEKMLKRTALDFLQRETPHEVIKDLLETETGCTDDLWNSIVDMGWAGIIIPEEYQGEGFPLTSAGVLLEALGSGPLPGPYFASAILGTLIVMEAGTEDQKREILPNVAEGKQILTLSLTESEYSWEPDAVQTKAVEENGNFVLNGVKLFTLEAKAATHFIVVARTGDSSDPAKGISLFLVDSESDGLSVEQVPGFLTGRSFEIKLNNVKVPGSAMLGEKDTGWDRLQQAFAKAIPLLCAYKVGGSQAVIEIALEYSRTRVQFGRPIGRFQRVQDMMIEMLNHADAARWTTYEALWNLDTDRPAAESVHLSKMISSTAYWEVVTLAHQVISGVSYSIEHAVSYHTRASRHLFNFLGEPAYHRHKLGKLLVPL